MHYQSTIIVSNKNLDLNSLVTFLKLDKENINPALALEINISDKLSIGIKDLEDLISWNALKSERIKIAIINDSDYLTTEASNAILKVVEEPSNNTLIVFVLKNLSSALPTIKSRCKIFFIDNEDSKEFNYSEFIAKDFFGRSKYLEELIENSNRLEFSKTIALIIENLLDDGIKNKVNLDDQIIKKLKKIYKSAAVGGNLKMVADNLNILIDSI